MITRITKQFLIFRSCLPILLVEIMFDVQWQWHKVKLSVRYVSVNTDLHQLDYLCSSIGGLMLKDIKPRHNPSQSVLLYQ